MGAKLIDYVQNRLIVSHKNKTDLAVFKNYKLLFIFTFEYMYHILQISNTLK